MRKQTEAANRTLLVMQAAEEGMENQGSQEPQVQNILLWC